MGDISWIDYDEVLHVTSAAVLLKIEEDEQWIPRSVIVEPVDGHGLAPGDDGDRAALLRWFAVKEGLTDD